MDRGEPKEDQEVSSQKLCSTCGAVLKSNVQSCQECGALIEKRPEKVAATTAGQNLITPYNLSLFPWVDSIRAAMRSSAVDVNGAITSLLVWGAINLGAWVIFGGADRDFLLRLSRTNMGILLLAYAGAIIGVVMLIFAVFGYLTKSRVVVLLDGISLIGVGVWNIIFDFLAMFILGPYGYKVNRDFFSFMWMYLGIFQLIWGGRQIRRFWVFGLGISEVERKRTRNFLEGFVKEPVSPEVGRLELSFVDTGKLAGEKLYSVQLFADRAFCIGKGLTDFFVIEKATVLQWDWLINKTIVAVDFYGDRKTIFLNEPSLRAFKDWSTVFADVKEGEPVHLSTICSFRDKLSYLILTKSRLIIRAPHSFDQDIEIPLSVITQFSIDKSMFGKSSLKVDTLKYQYTFHEVENMEEWITNLKALRNAPL
jgi:hypothetical protein